MDKGYLLYYQGSKVDNVEEHAPCGKVAHRLLNAGRNKEDAEKQLEGRLAKFLGFGQGLHGFRLTGRIVLFDLQLTPSDPADMWHAFAVP